MRSSGAAASVPAGGGAAAEADPDAVRTEVALERALPKEAEQRAARGQQGAVGAPAASDSALLKQLVAEIGQELAKALEGVLEADLRGEIGGISGMFDVTR